MTKIKETENELIEEKETALNYLKKLWSNLLKYLYYIYIKIIC